jgi:hypothetical protein
MAFTIFSCFGLGAVCTWFAIEGTWIADRFDAQATNHRPITRRHARSRNVMHPAAQTPMRPDMVSGQAWSSLRNAVRRGASAHVPFTERKNSISTTVHPVEALIQGTPPIFSGGNPSTMLASDEQGQGPPGNHDLEMALGNPVSASTSALEHGNGTGMSTMASPALKPIQSGFASVVRAMMTMLKETEPNISDTGVARSSASSTGVSARGVREIELGRPGGHTPSQLDLLLPKLEWLKMTHVLSIYQPLMKYLQFSPDGMLLATTNSEKLAIFRVGEQFEQLLMLKHILASCSQVAW